MTRHCRISLLLTLSLVALCTLLLSAAALAQGPPQVTPFSP